MWNYAAKSLTAVGRRHMQCGMCSPKPLLSQLGMGCPGSRSRAFTSAETGAGAEGGAESTGPTGATGATPALSGLSMRESMQQKDRLRREQRLSGVRSQDNGPADATAAASAGAGRTKATKAGTGPKGAASESNSTSSTPPWSGDLPFALPGARAVRAETLSEAFSAGPAQNFPGPGLGGQGSSWDEEEIDGLDLLAGRIVLGDRRFSQLKLKLSRKRLNFEKKMGLDEDPSYRRPSRYIPVQEEEGGQEGGLGQERGQEGGSEARSEGARAEGVGKAWAEEGVREVVSLDVAKMKRRLQKRLRAQQIDTTPGEEGVEGEREEGEEQLQQK